MKSTNNFTLSGRLTADATVYNDGKAVRFSVAHNFNQSKDPLYIDCVMFSKNGKKDVKIPMELLKKGTPVIVSGYQKPNVYINQEGRKISRTDYVILSCTSADAQDEGTEPIDITLT